MLLLYQGKEKPVSILSDEFSEEEVFPCLLPRGKFGYNVSRDIPINPAPYFNQQLLIFNQYFASDAGYIYFARSMYEQHHYILQKTLLCTKLSQSQSHQKWLKMIN